jgi:hypothetical protein
MKVTLEIPYNEIKNTSEYLIKTVEGYNLEVLNLTKAVIKGIVQTEDNVIFFDEKSLVKKDSDYFINQNIMRFKGVHELPCHFKIRSRNAEQEIIEILISDKLEQVETQYVEKIKTFGLTEHDLFAILEENNIVFKANINHFIVTNHADFFKLLGKEELTARMALDNLKAFLNRDKTI